MTFGTGVGEGDLLRVADELDIVRVGLIFGIAPEVQAVGDDGFLLNFDDEADAGDEDGGPLLLKCSILVP